LSSASPNRRALVLGGAALIPTLASAQTTEPDLFTTWRKLYASTENGELYWWSFGQISAQVQGLGEIPAVRTEAVRVCRIQSADDKMVVTWKEIGAYLDPSSGVQAKTWTNPVTGQSLPVARAFEEGVGVYTLTRDGALTLKQRWARPWRTTATARIDAGLLILDQDEVKTRAFPYPDGESPDITEPNAGVNDHRFQIYGDARTPSARAAGRFTTLFGGAPSWMVFPGRVTRAVASGVMYKTLASADAFPAARARLAAVHPDYFRKGAISWD
jgi:hypothetical protein